MLRASEEMLEKMRKQKAKNKYVKGEIEFDRLLSEMCDADEYRKNRDFSMGEW